MNNYKTINKLNQSLLKEILKSPQAFLRAKERYQSDEGVIAPHFVFGSLVDHLITEDHNTFEDIFYLTSESSCSDTIIKVVTHCFEENPTGKLEDHYESIVRGCGYEVYGQSWKEETRVKKVIEQGSEYFNMLIESAGKTIVFGEEYNKALISHASLLSDPYTSKYLKPNNNQQLIKKQIVEFTYKSIELKGELDLVFIDHNNKTITPIDVKTIGTSVYQFPFNFWKFRYDFQAAVYTYGIECTMNKLINQGYVIDNFKFLVVEKESQNTPLIYSIDNDVLEIGMNGGSLPSGRSYEGFEQAINKYLFHIEKNDWSYPMEYYKQGEITIDL